MSTDQFESLRSLLARVYANSPFYSHKFTEADIPLESIQTYEDFQRLPFSDKDELRLAYPLGLLSVPQDEVVLIPSLSDSSISFSALAWPCWIRPPLSGQISLTSGLYLKPAHGEL